MDDCARRYGDWFTIRLRRRLKVVFTSDSQAVKDLFAGDPDKLYAGEQNNIFKPLLGRQSILVLDGSAHRRVRRLMMPPFHGDRMKAYGSVIGGIVARRMESWPEGEVLRLHPELQAITLEVILKTIIGLSEGERVSALRARLVELLESNQSATDMFLTNLLLDAEGRPPLAAVQRRLGRFSLWGRFLSLREEIDRLVFAEIAERRRAGGPRRDDILSLLIAAKDQDGDALDDQELRDEMITLLVAGHETSATALSWIFSRLSAHPEVLRKLRDELAALPVGPPDPAAVMSLPYLDAVINETLRLNPIVPFVWRILKEPLRLGGRDFPAGVAVAPSIYLLHRSAKIWPDPERFDPDRFLDSKPAPWEFLPFGGGHRRCLGQAFAVYEIKMVLATVLQAMIVRPAPGYGVKVVRRGIAFAPSDQTPVVFESASRALSADSRLA